MRRFFGPALGVATVVLIAVAPPATGLGQEPQQEKWSRLLGPDGEALPPAQRNGGSGFALFGSADFGRVDMNLSGQVFYCWENRLGDWTETFICPYGFQPSNTTDPAQLAFRTMGYHYGVPPSEWEKVKLLVPSLANATGGGYSVFSSYTEEPLVAPMPMDGSLGPIQSGITSTGDVPCQDQDPWGDGVPMLAAIDCPQSWGSLAWTGANLIPEEVYDSAFTANPSSFAFDFWRFPNAYSAGQPGANPIGAFVTYGFESDWSEEKRAGYGSVIPGGTGDPQRQGWPLGLVVRTDAFTVPVPALANVLFTQTIVINRSQDVYGVPLDYDSLYFGLSASFWWHSNIQNASFYFEPWSGAVKSVTVGVSPTCNGGNNPADIFCTAITNPTLDGGFRKGKWGGGYAILKSPIGDLRNKLFTSPVSGFFDSSHPLAGDTITYNHGHMCGFRACTATTWRAVAGADWQRRMFGMLSSITADVMGTRTFATISNRDYWHITRSYTHPTRSDPTTSDRRGQGFNTHIPGVDPETRQGMGAAATWDYNKDGTPDTLFLDTCNPFGCVDTWSDTLRGPVGSGPYTNAYGNVGSVVAAGPFPLAAGDTASWVMAWFVAPSQADVEKFAGNAIAHYLNFYSAPAAPPPPTVKSVVVAPGDPTQASVKLYFGDESELWVDPFLVKRASQLPSEAVSEENPWLPDSMAFLAENNLQAVHIFRSCDGGDTFDADGDCEGDPATGGKFEPLGWQPYATFELDELGEIPNVFEDNEVTGGVSYLYILVAESRGAEPLVRKPDGRAEVFSIAPKLFSALTRGSQAADVYLPLSVQAGASRARVTVANQAGPAPIAPDGFHPLSLTAAGDDPVGGIYRVLLGKPVTVTESTYGDPEEPDSVVTTVVVTNDITGADSTFTTRRLEGVTTLGGAVTETPGDPFVRTTTHSALTAVVILEDTADEPLLTTSTLAGDAATPGTFITRSDWPKVLLSVSQRLGEFNRQFFVFELTADTVADVARPAITWGVGAASASGESFGDYNFRWAATAFGPNSPFVLDFANPENTESAIAASIALRTVPQRTMPADAEALALAQAALTALGQTTRANNLTTADIVDQASLPFAIRNRTFATAPAPEGRLVEAIMLRRPRDDRILGRGGDTLRVAVPGNAWLPGDTLILVEEVPTAPGATTTEKRVTWNRSVLACFETVQFTRETCNPVSGTGQSLFLSPREGQVQHVQYFNAFTSESRYRFDVRPAVSGAAISAGDVRSGLARVKVVPNPFIVFAQTGTSTILFTNMPPRGRLRIYTLAGQFVQQITWEASDLARATLGAQTSAQGDLRYDLRTQEGTLLASGLYIFHLAALDDGNQVIGEKLGKFVIIR